MRRRRDRRRPAAREGREVRGRLRGPLPRGRRQGLQEARAAGRPRAAGRGGVRRAVRARLGLPAGRRPGRPGRPGPAPGRCPRPAVPPHGPGPVRRHRASLPHVHPHRRAPALRLLRRVPAPGVAGQPLRRGLPEAQGDPRRQRRERQGRHPRPGRGGAGGGVRDSGDLLPRLPVARGPDPRGARADLHRGRPLRPLRVHQHDRARPAVGVHHAGDGAGGQRELGERDPPEGPRRVHRAGRGVGFSSARSRPPTTRSSRRSTPARPSGSRAASSSTSSGSRSSRARAARRGPSRAAPPTCTRASSATPSSCRCRRASRCSPAAWRWGWSGWRWRCSPSTASIRRAGRPACARPCSAAAEPGVTPPGAARVQAPAPAPARAARCRPGSTTF